MTTPLTPDSSNIEDWIDSLDKEQVAIKGTTFTFRKLGAEDAFDVLEDIRESIGGRTVSVMATKQLLSSASTENVRNLMMEVFVTLMGVVVAMPKVDAQRVRKALFKETYFTNQHAKVLLPIDGNENFAFADIEPVQVYELWMRSMVVNFRGSWSVMSSLLGLSSPSLP